MFDLKNCMILKMLLSHLLLIGEAFGWRLEFAYWTPSPYDMSSILCVRMLLWQFCGFFKMRFLFAEVVFEPCLQSSLIWTFVLSLWRGFCSLIDSALALFVLVLSSTGGTHKDFATAIIVSINWYNSWSQEDLIGLKGGRWFDTQLGCSRVC